MDCRNFETFAKEFDRMCSYYIEKEKTCYNCPFYHLGCYQCTKENPANSVEILQKWSDEHLIKTRQSEFLKLFPNAEIDKGIINILPCTINTAHKSNECVFLDGCYACAKKYWLTEVE